MGLLDAKVPGVAGVGSGTDRASTSIISVGDGMVRPIGLSLGEHR
jgi:hypothetical protein